MTGTFAAFRLTGPWEECENGSGVSYLIAEVDVVRAWVVIVDSQLDETQAQDFGVEVEGLLRVAGYRGYVVDAEDTFDHSVC